MLDAGAGLAYVDITREQIEREIRSDSWDETS